MNCDVVGFIALDEILRFFFGGMVGVALECHIRNDFLHDSAANPAGFRIPFDVIAASERPRHLPPLPNLKMHHAMRWSGGKRCQLRLQHHEEYRVRA